MFERGDRVIVNGAYPARRTAVSYHGRIGTVISRSPGNPRCLYVKWGEGPSKLIFEGFLDPISEPAASQPPPSDSSTKKTGRRFKLDPSRRAEIREAVRVGATKTSLARQYEVHLATVYRIVAETACQLSP